MEFDYLVSRLEEARNLTSFLLSSDWDFKRRGLLDEPSDEFLSAENDALLKLFSILSSASDFVHLTDSNSGLFIDRIQTHIFNCIYHSKSKSYFKTHFADVLEDLIIIVNRTNNIALLKPTHGGARSGSGRKQKLPVSQVRMPTDLIQSLNNFKSIFNSLDSADRILAVKRFDEFLLSLQSDS